MWRNLLLAPLACAVACSITGERFTTRSDAGADESTDASDARTEPEPDSDAVAVVGPKAYVIHRDGAIFRALRATDGTLSDPVVVYQAAAGTLLDTALTNPGGTRLYVPVTAAHQLLHFGIERDGSLALRETLDLPCAPARGVRHPGGQVMFFGCEHSLLVVTLDATGNVAQTTMVPASSFSVAEPVVEASGGCLATFAPAQGNANRFQSWSFSVATNTLAYIHVTPFAVPLGPPRLATHPTQRMLYVGVGAQLFAGAISIACDQPPTTPTAIPAVGNITSLVVDAARARLLVGGDGVRVYDIATAPGTPAQIGAVDLTTPAVALTVDPAAPDRLYIVTNAGIVHASVAAGGTITLRSTLPVGTAPTSLVLAP